jgi:plastocyanin
VRPAAITAALFLALATGVAACGGDGGGSSYRQPKGPAQTTLRIQAGNFYFRPGTVHAPAGIDRVELVGKGGHHTLVIDRVDGFKLSVGGDGDTDSAKVSFRAGRYTFYCDIPGHRDAGMEGTFVIS